MGTFSKDKTEKLIKSGGGQDEALRTIMSYFHPFPEDYDIRGGAELEVHLVKYNHSSGNFALANKDEHIKLFDRLENNEDISESEEPANHMVEVKNDDPIRLENIGESAQDISNQIRLVTEELKNVDPELIILPFATVSFTTGGEALANLLPPPADSDPDSYVHRPYELMQAFKDCNEIDDTAVKYPVTETAVHFTYSPHSTRHVFEMSKLLTTLMPFLFVALENRPPYQNNSEERTRVHTGIATRHALGGRGVIRDFVYAARNEQELLEMNARDVFETPMLAYNDHEGIFRAVPKTETVFPTDMNGLGPEDVSQFEMAMSGKWGPLKFKLAQSDKIGMLHELRDFDSSPDNIKNVNVLFSMLASKEDIREQLFTALDEVYGIPVLDDPAAAETIIKSNLDDALHRGDADYMEAKHGKRTDRFMETPFGANGHTMSDLLNDTLLPLMESHYEGRSEHDMLDTWQYIAETGNTNAQFWYDMIDSLEDQKKLVRAMTRDSDHYHELYASGKSFAQLYHEEKLPGFDYDMSRHRTHDVNPPRANL